MNVFIALGLPLLVVTTQVGHAVTSELHKIVHSEFQPLIDKSLPKDKRYQSLIVGIVTPFETQIIPLGRTFELGNAPTEKIIFEIGSITKGFLGLLLVQESLKGSLDLDRPFNLNSDLKLASYAGTEVTWRNLAQHTAGLPRLPDNFTPADPLQPYVDYDIQKLKAFVSGFKPNRPPGTASDYSKLGAGLVGYALEQKYKMSFEQLLLQGFLKKLGMVDTSVQLTAEQSGRLAPVFKNGIETQPWQWNISSVLQGAGALRSTAKDMTILLKTMMGLGAPEFLPISTLATDPTFRMGNNFELGLFWQHLKAQNITWHNGATFGSRSFFGFDPDRLVGIVVLSNSSLMDAAGVDQRFDLASIEVIQKVVASLKMDKPIKVLKDIDVEIARRVSEFRKTPAAPEDKEWVRLKMAHMVDIDQYIRSLFSQVSEHGFDDREIDFFHKAYRRRIHMLDWKNTQDLKQLIKIHGWFKISEWGSQLDNQAWLLVQHADNDPDFQIEVLKTLSVLYKINETAPSNYAYLFDRVAASSNDPSKGRPQRYGTQGFCAGPGKWEPLEIEDAAKVDSRRAEVGLPPLKEYIEFFKDICK